MLLETRGYVHADVALFVWALVMYEGGFVVFLILLMSFLLLFFFLKGLREEPSPHGFCSITRQFLAPGLLTLCITVTHSSEYSPVLSSNSDGNTNRSK